MLQMWKLLGCILVISMTSVLRFENLKALAKKKRAEVDAALAVQEFCGDVDETMVGL